MKRVKVPVRIPSSLRRMAISIEKIDKAEPITSPITEMKNKNIRIMQNFFLNKILLNEYLLFVSTERI